MDLSLNADTALRAYLPPESWNGDAQHRFLFRTEDGEEEPLLARLAVVRPADTGRKFEHCVILRPENAESERVFIVERFRYYDGDKEIDPLMSSRMARRFNWSLFERDFNGSDHIHGLSRFCLKQASQDVVLKIGPDGWGEVLAYDDSIGLVMDSPDSVRFLLSQDFYSSERKGVLQFLRHTNRDFQNQMSVRCDELHGEIRTAVKWQSLGNTERDLLAFKCQNGCWNDLTQIATAVLCVWLAHVADQSTLSCEWDFANFPQIEIRGARLRDSNTLFLWRKALTKAFRTENINAQGAMVGQRPVCLWSHIISSELRFINIDLPSQHELLEAQLQLREWANAHFPPEEAQRLLSLRWYAKRTGEL